MKDFVRMFDLIMAVAFLIIVLVIGIVDVIAVLSDGRIPTVSERIYTWSQRFPLLPLVVGIICGHLFFPLRLSPGQ